MTFKKHRTQIELGEAIKSYCHHCQREEGMTPEDSVKASLFFIIGFYSSQNIARAEFLKMVEDTYDFVEQEKSAIKKN